jgi:hypothetical protein
MIDFGGLVSLSRLLGTETARHPAQMQDRTETVAETADLKSLARRVLQRDTARDSNRVTASHAYLSQGKPARQGLVTVSDFGALRAYSRCMAALQDRCPDLVDERCRQRALQDGSRFLERWAEQAQALGWTPQDLFGLPPVPSQPAASYRRLSRYDGTGLIWLLRGRAVVALTQTAAAIENPTGAITIYRKNNKPALGPVGDSIDDFE